MCSAYGPVPRSDTAGNLSKRHAHVRSFRIARDAVAYDLPSTTAEVIRMGFPMKCMAQPGTRVRLQDIGSRRPTPRALVSLLALGLSAGCTETSALGPDASDVDANSETPASRRDGGETDAEIEADQQPDTGTPDAGDAGPPDTPHQPNACEEQARAIETFVAAHRSCETNADCVIVGDCSHADFRAVAREFEAEAKDLVFGDDACGALDGPTYHAVCRAGSCERVQSVHSCGYVVSPYVCPSGSELYEEGCGPVAATFRGGCYRPCAAEGDDASCAAGFTCQQTTTNPCTSTPGGGAACAACGAESWLCLPAPACQVELSLEFNGAPTGRVFTGRATALELLLENRTDEAITLSFDVPCHGPRVQGLGDYDLWQECLAGACLEDPVHTELTLAPREKRLWRSAVLDLQPSDCNVQGLPSGKYAPTFALANVVGATICGPAPALLLTGTEARR